MVAVMLNGFLTGLILQIAIGPVFFFILNISLQKTAIDALFAILAVSLVDYIFITLAVLGVGKILERPKIKIASGIIGSLVLIMFGIVMMLSIRQISNVDISNNVAESSYTTSFISAFLLTSSSPLTIVFWTSLFATKAIEKGYAQKQLIYFGLAAGLATLVFLGFSATLLSIIRAAIPLAVLRFSNAAVGLLLVVYGVMRLGKIVINTKALQRI